MVINLTTLTGKFAKTEVEFMGQSCKIMYDPLQITQAAITKSQGNDDDFIEFFCSVVKSWDIQRSGKKVPLTKTGLQGIPLPLLQAIYKAVVFNSADDVEAEGKASNDG